MKKIFLVLTMKGYMIEDKMILQWVISSKQKFITYFETFRFNSYRLMVRTHSNISSLHSDFLVVERSA